MPLIRPKLHGRVIERIPVAQNKVIQWVCDRCEAQELRPQTPESEFKDRPALSLEFNGQITSWLDLCESCSKTVGNYIANILKAKKKGSEDEPLPTTTPRP